MDQKGRGKQAGNGAYLKLYSLLFILNARFIVKVNSQG